VPQNPTDPCGSAPVIEIELSELRESIALYRRYRKFKDSLAEIPKAPEVSEQEWVALADGEVIEFLQHDAEIVASNIHKPLVDQFIAMHDLCCGWKPSLLFEAPRPADVTTKPRITFAHLAQGALAIGYAALVERGRMKPAKAKQWLDEELRKHGLISLVRGDDIQGWYHQVKAADGKGKPAPALVEAFRRFQSDFSKMHNAAEAKAFAASYLDTVRDLKPPRLKLRHSAG
jgi:hypothetical protein